jgi:hypothetical protein
MHLAEGGMSYTKWNPVQACVWIATHDESAVASLRSNHTFAELIADLELIDSGHKALLIEPGMTNLQLCKAIDAMPLTAKPGITWIGDAKRELLEKCWTGKITMRGRPLSGGSSQDIPAAAFDEMEFYDELPGITGEFHDGLSHTLIERLSSLEQGGGGVWMGLPEVARNAAGCWCDLVLQADQVRSVWKPKESRAPNYSLSDTVIMASMETMIRNIRDAGDRTTGHAIVTYMMNDFRGRVTERRLRNLYGKLDKDLKGKRGPKGPRISRQNS